MGPPAPTPEKAVKQEKAPKEPRSSEAPRRVAKPSKKAAEAAAAGRSQEANPAERNKDGGSSLGMGSLEDPLIQNVGVARDHSGAISMSEAMIIRPWGLGGEQPRPTQMNSMHSGFTPQEGAAPAWYSDAWPPARSFVGSGRPNNGLMPIGMSPMGKSVDMVDLAQQLMDSGMATDPLDMGSLRADLDLPQSLRGMQQDGDGDDELDEDVMILGSTPKFGSTPHLASTPQELRGMSRGVLGSHPRPPRGPSMLGRSSHDGQGMPTAFNPAPPPTSQPPASFYQVARQQNAFSRPERANQYQGGQTPSFQAASPKQEPHPAQPAAAPEDGSGGADESQLSESFFDHQLMGMSPDAPWASMQGVVTAGPSAMGFPGHNPPTQQWGFAMNGPPPGTMQPYAPLQ
ncbi:hypothetical protein WJX84_011195 [Apatococcus fuscideae]|uniref:Uncharacterized protein n=1 Tax=Apatococcus fuscideae TaxID=2026836 RepID=A0AAW1SNP9_9CHLO